MPDDAASASASAALPASCPPGTENTLTVCPDAGLDAELAMHSHVDPDITNNAPSGPGCPLMPGDLTPAPLQKPPFDPAEEFHGFVGSQDLDGDGREDAVLMYSAVDYWQWFLFVEAALLRVRRQRERLFRGAPRGALARPPLPATLDVPDQRPR